MDIFTHALIPYLIGSIPKLNKRELTALVLGGIAPDLDFLFLVVNYRYPSDLLLVHRGITHTLIFGFLTALVVLYAVSCCRAKRIIQRFTGSDNLDLSLTRKSLAFIYAGVLSHLFLDYLTTRGVPLFYPIDTSRLSAEVFSSVEVVFAITSLVIIAVLLRYGQGRSAKVWLFAVLLMVIIAAGSIRIEGKEMSEMVLVDGGAKSYPEANLFKWSILEDNGNRFDVYEYDLLSGTTRHKTAFSHLEVSQDASSSRESLGAALKTAEGLPQIELFRWRAYAVAINASLKEDVWHLEYFDPVVRAEQIHSMPVLKTATGSYSSIKVKVDANNAVVI